MPASYVLVKDGDLWAIAHDTVSFRKPVKVRVLWRPTAPEHRVLMPDRCMGQFVEGARNDGALPTQRWVHFDALTRRNTVLTTPREGERTVVGPVPKPRGKQDSLWYWEAGEWRRLPPGVSPASFDLRIDDCWHYLPSSKTLSPPRNPAEAERKAEP